MGTLIKISMLGKSTGKIFRSDADPVSDDPKESVVSVRSNNHILVDSGRKLLLLGHLFQGLKNMGTLIKISMLGKSTGKIFRSDADPVSDNPNESVVSVRSSARKWAHFGLEFAGLGLLFSWLPNLQGC